MAGIELKPVKCGCGGEAEPYAWVYGSYSVHCLSCGIETVNCKTPEEAIRTWNTAMGADNVDELIEHIWREKLDTREKIVDLVERMLR